MKTKVYNNSVRSCMLHGSQISPVKNLLGVV